MIPHFINKHDVVLSVDFDAKRMLIGETWPGGRGQARQIGRHVRITWQAADEVVVEVPSYGAPELQAIDADAWAWRRLEAQHYSTLKVSYERAPVTVDRSDFARALTTIGKLVKRRTDEAALVDVSLASDALTVRAPAWGLTWSRATKREARNGLGTVRVFAAELKRVSKEASTRNVSLEIDYGSRELVVGMCRVWTVAGQVDAVPSTATGEWSSTPELTHALSHASKFAHASDTRPNLVNVRVVFEGCSALVEATDGHNAFRASVDVFDEFSSRVEMYIPSATLRALFGKKPSTVGIRFDEDGAPLLHVGEFVVSGLASPPPMPPLDFLFGEQARAERVNADHGAAHPSTLSELDYAAPSSRITYALECFAPDEHVSLQHMQDRGELFAYVFSTDAAEVVVCKENP